MAEAAGLRQQRVAVGYPGALTCCLTCSGRSPARVSSVTKNTVTCASDHVGFSQHATSWTPINRWTTR